MTTPSEETVPSVHDDPDCVTCGNSKSWHATNPARHPFNDGSVPVSDTFGKRGKDKPRDLDHDKPQPRTVQARATTRGWPLDPVLRQALMDKGVLTIEDLRAAEEKILATTGQIMTEGEEEGGKQPRR